jgi:glucose/mannose-6-phosphate isomerase
MNIQDLLNIDSQNMHHVIKNFPEQIKEAIEIGKDAKIYSKSYKPDSIIILGMGGSAIGGDLLSSFIQSSPETNVVSIKVNRNYNINQIIGDSALVIASSYSGNTEETISAFESARKQTNNLLCISSGGNLFSLAEKYNLPIIKIPSGYQPRCALAYSFFPLLYILIRLNLFSINTEKKIEKAIEETIEKISQLSDIYSVPDENNIAFSTAKKIANSIPIIYSSTERLDSVNLRWRDQINENAKNLCYGSLLPEMNHNEINSFSHPQDLIQRLSIIYLKDKDDHPRISDRFDALSDIMEGKVNIQLSFSGNGEYFLTRMFELVYLGDWISYYLAIENKIDPTPIPVINYLKERLSS